MQSLLQDFRFGVRLILRNPGFAGLAVLVLALGIGANTAVFTLINNLILRPAPFESPDRLVSCHSKNTKTPDSYRQFSYPNYLDIREKNTVFTDLMAHSVAMVGIKEGDTTRRVFSEIVSSNYFKTFGVSLRQGRTFTPDEEKPGAANPVVIVSYDYWRRAGADPGQRLGIFPAPGCTPMASDAPPRASATNAFPSRSSSPRRVISVEQSSEKMPSGAAISRFLSA